MLRPMRPLTPESGATLRSLNVGDVFRFNELTYDRDGLYTYNGVGWYGSPYSGGPWHTSEDPAVLLVEPGIVSLFEVVEPGINDVH